MRYLICFIIGFSVANLSAQSTSFDEKVTTVSNVRLAVSNVGTFGNAFRGYRDGTAKASCEYPAGSGVEHLFESGIWVGAERNGTFLVSTAAVDASQGYQTGGSGFEFTAAVGEKLEERSSFKDNPYFSPFAVSHQDYVADFTDKNLTVPGTNIQIVGHTQPLFIDVKLKTYNFNFAFSNFVVFVDMEIVNLGNQGGENQLDSLFFGLWSNAVVRNINITPPGSGGSAFYNKGGNGYLDSLYMAYCYDHSGDVGYTNSYIGQKFLGAEDKNGFHHPKVDSTFQANYNAWQFNNPGTGTFDQPQGTQQQYNRLSKGLEDDSCWTNPTNCGGGTFQQQLNTAGNRSDLLSVGPFNDFKKGDTIKIAYAFVLAPKIDDGNSNTANTAAQQAQFHANAKRVQTAYNGEDVNFNGVLDAGEDKDKNGKISRFILPSPPNIPKTKVVAKNHSLTIYWSDNAEASIDPISQTKDFEGYRLYLTKTAFDVAKTQNLLKSLKPIAEYDIKNNGYANEVGLDAIRMDQPKTFEGDTTVYHYQYTINKLLNGWQYAIGLSAFDRGDPEQNLKSLESSLLGNNFRVFPGKPINESIEENAPFVYPNPYYFGAAWEGRSNFQEQSRKLIFANLPKRCVIRIFTPAGDLIDQIKHNRKYNGSDIRWYETFAGDREQRSFSGGEHAWDLLSSYTQIISRGVYIFAVEDLDTGEIKKGKFTILK